MQLSDQLFYLAVIADASFFAQVSDTGLVLAITDTLQYNTEVSDAI
jgi:hypothetical protein